MRNLGFEDTPDYDYLRDLFTQALKNAGEVEDGEYDWMKLNNGKGWEALKHSSPGYLHPAAQQPLNPTTRALGGEHTPRGPGTNHRINSTQPIPPSPAKQGVSKGRDRPGVGGALQKRQSGLAAGLTSDVATPTASTQAQFQHSTANLPNPRTSTANPGAGQTSTGLRDTRLETSEDKPSAAQKFKKFICCGGR